MIDNFPLHIVNNDFFTAGKTIKGNNPITYRNTNTHLV